MSDLCAHVTPDLDAVPAPRTPDVCEECSKIGGRWVHLRPCLECRHVGCCDNSPGRHVTKHFHDTGHPLVRSYEPGEDWWWCYVDDAFFEIEGAASAPSHT